LGVDLNGNGVTLNDPGDGDQGVNDLQNFPVVTVVGSDATGTTVLGVMNSTPNTALTLAFFANPVCDPSGFGEGEQILGSWPVTTDSNGNAVYAATLPATAPRGAVVSAMATGPAGSSEFSSCRVIGAAQINKLLKLKQLKRSYDPTPAPNAPAGTMRLTATFTNQSELALTQLYFAVTTLDGGRLLLNAADGPGAVGSVLSAAASIGPKATVAVTFVIGLPTRRPFDFYVDGYGLLPAGAAGAAGDAGGPALLLPVDEAALTAIDYPIYLPLVNR
jgi:hypothetical protein